MNKKLSKIIISSFLILLSLFFLYFLLEKEVNLEEACSAISSGDMVKFQKFLKSKHDIDSLVAPEYTLLHFAVGKNQTDAVKLLLEHGANVNMQNNLGSTPLHLAIGTKNAELVAMLLSAGALIEIEDSTKYNAMHYAAIMGNKKIAELLATKKPNLIDSPEGTILPIQLACIRGHLDVVKVFLDAGANINCIGFQDGSPLHAAIMGGQKAIALYLLEKGSEVNAKSKEIETPLVVCVLSAASNFDRLGLCKLLIEKGANPHLPCKGQETILNHAVGQNHYEIAEYFLSIGVDFSRRNAKGNTALHIAAYGNSLPLVKLLLLHGADVTIQNNDGKTPADMTSDNEIKELLSKAVSK